MLRRRRFLLFALVVAALAAAPAHALRMPDLTIGAGSTMAVSGLPSDGGLTAHGTLTWPVTERFRFGVAGYADDLGTEVLRLLQPVTFADLGAHAERHRWSWGVAWLGETTLARKGRWTVDGSLTWGFHRVEDDERGVTLRAISSVGAGAEVAGRRSIGAGQSLGVSVRWQQLFMDRPKQVFYETAFDMNTPQAQRDYVRRVFELNARQNLPSGWAAAALEWRWGAR